MSNNVKPLKPWLPKPQNEVPVKQYKGYQPPWIIETPEKSYRSIFKWGHPSGAKAPRESLYKLLKKTFGMTDEDFQTPIFAGLEEVEVNSPITLTKEQIKNLKMLLAKILLVKIHIQDFLLLMENYDRYFKT